MDSRDDARLLSGSEYDDAEPCFPISKSWTTILTYVLIVSMLCLMPFAAFSELQEMGRIKFSMEPVVSTGLDLAAAPAAVPPSFNVTLRAKSTYGLIKVCTTRRGAMEVSYSGITIAMGEVQPFCMDPKEEKLITTTASPGWPVLPIVLQESMESDRRHGEVQLEVDFGFDFDDDKEASWVRCRTTLYNNKASPCNVYFIRGFAGS